jgi:hypothetical protein
MFVAGRPAWSSGYFTFKVTKSGPKDQTISKFDESQTIGDPKTGKHIVTTYRRIYPKSKGGVGIWKLQVIPHFSKVKGIDPSLKYGCVITVHSSSSPTMYREISNWLDARRKLAEALLKQEQPPKIAAREREEPLTLARVP